jgi:hypothetical protein
MNQPTCLVRITSCRPLSVQLVKGLALPVKNPSSSDRSGEVIPSATVTPRRASKWCPTLALTGRSRASKSSLVYGMAELSIIRTTRGMKACDTQRNSRASKLGVRSSTTTFDLLQIALRGAGQLWLTGYTSAPPRRWPNQPQQRRAN